MVRFVTNNTNFTTILCQNITWKYPIGFELTLSYFGKFYTFEKIVTVPSKWQTFQIIGVAKI